jgi:hypothetical protein
LMTMTKFPEKLSVPPALSAIEAAMPLAEEYLRGANRLPSRVIAV